MKESEEIIIKNNNEIDLPRIINSEVNLLVFPFFVLERKSKKLETEYKDIVKRGGQKIKIVWNVSANPKYGYPGPFDREVHKAIEQIISEILREKGKIKNPIPFSLYDLCNRMGITSAGGDNYQRIKKALEKIRATTIKSEGALYQKKEKKWISKVFGIYDGVTFRGEQLEDGTIAEKNLLYLGDIYLQSLNSFYVKPIDYNYLRNLKSKIASTTHKYISLAKQQLDPGNNELRDTGFILKYEWSENGNNDWLIRYWPGERAKEEIKRAKIKSINNRTGEYLPGPKEGAIKYSKEQVNLVNKLLELNVSKITAENLIKNNDQGLIEKWIEAINYSNAGDKAAYLVKAIRENWQVPEEYLRKKREKQQKEEEKKTEYNKIKLQEEENKKRQEEIKRIGQIYNSLAPLQQEEIRIETEKSLPDFWKEKLNKVKVKGTSSKLLEGVLEEKRREIIKEWINSGRIEDINSRPLSE